MKLIEINWSPQDRQLRQFGVICFVAFQLITWLWIGNTLPVLGVSFAIGLTLAVAGFVSPKLLKPIFVGLSIVTLPVGLIVGELAMLLIFFLLIAPIGLAFRTLRRDGLKMSIDRDAETYWSPKKQARGPSSYFRQS